MTHEQLIDLILDNLRNLLFPEQWIKLDLSISKTELLALLIVSRHGEVIMTQIAEYINAPLSTTTGLVNRLVKHGYLERARSDEDRRIVAITLTDKGKAIVNEVQETIATYLGRINGVLSTEEQQFLLQIFTKVLNALSHSNLAQDNGNPEEILKSIPID